MDNGRTPTMEAEVIKGFVGIVMWGSLNKHQYSDVRFRVELWYRVRHKDLRMILAILQASPRLRR